MNESYILYNTSTFKQCVEEMSSSLVNHLVALVRMDQTHDVLQEEEEVTKYEFTVRPT